MISRKSALLILFTSFLTMNDVEAQPKDANYDEAKVGSLPIPDPLKMEDGRTVATAEMWSRERRPELLEIFRREVYGRSPAKPAGIKFVVRSEDKQALGGKATRREVTIFLKEDKSGPPLNLLLYIPNTAGKSVPAFLGLNFEGNHTVHSDPGITLGVNPLPNSRKPQGEEARGSKSERWQVEKVIAAGYALATMHYGDIDPDFHDGFKNGVHPLFYKPGQTEPAADEWGSIAAWAWGLSRAMDYLETVPEIDARKVAVLGHSRLGKTALWAGAEDQRFAIVISNNSGCGGAALSKRTFGETVGRINRSFPHWFCANFKKYNENEKALPVDQHQLIALSAPRPVYVASAAEDLWADPKGEFLGAKLAEPVFKLFGKEGLPSGEPQVNQPLMGTLGYHIREGKHDVTAYDWEQYIRFANKHFGRR